MAVLFVETDCLAGMFAVSSFCCQNGAVEVAVQLTDIKYVIGGKHFRLFRFSCSGLGPDGKVQDLSTGSNPK